MQTQDVELWSLDASQNRFRVYGIAEMQTLFGEPALRIVWGRLGRRPLRARTEIFESPRALGARRSALVALRTKHGYFAPAALGATRGMVFGACVGAAPQVARRQTRESAAQLALWMGREGREGRERV